ncbi:MAG: hypothetical protein KIT31_30175 [Deltaproteobacteria bacterium]|nr:hypothetical protein [Deltaproteobacteria bacterium]
MLPLPDGRRDAAVVAQLVVERRGKRDWGASLPVDVLVDPEAADVDAQQVVDLVAALDAAGVRTIGLGMLPAADAEQGRLRGHRTPAIELGRPSVRGRGRDAAEVLRRLELHHDDLVACYDAALPTDPALAGRGALAGDIDRAGKLAISATTSSLDTCFREVLTAVDFGPGAATPIYLPFELSPDGSSGALARYNTTRATVARRTGRLRRAPYVLPRLYK